MRRAFTTAMLSLCLAGCFGRSGPLKTTPIAPSELPAADDVLLTLKEDLSNYNLYQAAHENDPAAQTVCKGRVSFEVESVAVLLTVVNQDSTGASIGAKVPIAGIELGPGLGGSNAYKSSHKVNLLIKPAPAPPASPTAVPDARPGSFDYVLRNLREAMIRSSRAEPCFTFPADQKNSVEASFQVVKDRNAKFGVSFLIFSAGAETKSSVETLNSITINFKAMGGWFIDEATGSRSILDSRFNHPVHDFPILLNSRKPAQPRPPKQETPSPKR